MRSAACLLVLFLLLLGCGDDDRRGGSDAGTETGTGDAAGRDAYIPPGVACDWPATSCDGVCVDTQTDVASCGGCGRACADGRVCSGGLCIAACDGAPVHGGIGAVASEPTRPAGEGSWLSTADLDGDGEVDLVMRADDYLYRQLGAGDGTFGPPLEVAMLDGLGGSPTIVDLDGDSAPEVVISGRDGTWVLPGVGDGTFDAPALAAIGRLMAVADFDGANGPDLLLQRDGAMSGSLLGVALRRADGTFAESVLSPPLPLFFSAVAGDFDGDGDLDAAFYEREEARAGWVRGDGSGGLSAPSTVVLETSHPDRLIWLDGAMAAGRFTGGSRDEIVVGLRDFGSWSPTEMFLLRVSSAGALESVTRHENAERVSWLRARDLDGDGLDELVAASGDITAVIRFDAAGTPAGRYFATRSSGLNDGRPQGDLADIDGDGHLELVAPSRPTLASAVTVYAHLGHPPGGLSGMSVCFPAQATELAVGDLDADGFDDVVALGFDGVGTLFGGADQLATGTAAPLERARAVAIGDLDADGDLDVAVPRGDGVAILRNGGGRAFEVEVVAVGAPQSLTIVDFDHDGHADLMDESRGLRGPSFVAELTLPPGYPFLFGDLNGDGIADAVGRLGPYLNTGGGTFEQAGPHPIEDAHTEGVEEQALGDVDGDGALDLVVGWGDGRVHVARGVGDGSFEAPVSVDVGDARDPFLGDWDGDGADEIFVLHLESDSSTGRVEVLALRGGAVASIATVSVGNEATEVRLGDFDGDGVVDLVAGHFWGAYDPIPSVAIAAGRCPM